MCLVNSPQSGNNSLQHTDPLNSPQNSMTSSRFFPFTKTSQSHKYHPFRGMFYKVQNNQESPKILSLITQVTCNSRHTANKFPSQPKLERSQPSGLLCYL